MAVYKCPKCNGSDYFMSQRNVVKGMGWAQRGSIKSIPVCRQCDEIMQGAQVGLKSWEDIGRSRKVSNLTIILFILIPIFFLGYIYVSASTFEILFFMTVVGWTVSFIVNLTKSAR